MNLPLVSLTLLAAVALSAVASEQRTLRWVIDKGQHCVELTGLSDAELDALRSTNLDRAAWDSVLDVRIAGSGRTLPGNHRIEGKKIVFVPRFPLETELKYIAVHRRELNDPAEVVARFELPASPDQKTTKLLHVHPILDVVPENLLKIYLTFSAPMSRGQVYSRVKLLDEQGKALELPFLELGEELWDRSQTRITLLFDPGRIKSGLKPREEEGPILVEGKRYTFVVDAGWPDAQGRPLVAGYSRTFRAGPPDTRSPDPRSWKVTAPNENSKEPLRIVFEESLDRALALRLITVMDPNATEVEGETTVDDAARVWQFVPARPWRAGKYRVSVGVTLEDLAGNSVEKPFEVDLFQVDRPGKRTEPFLLPFQVGVGR